MLIAIAAVVIVAVVVLAAVFVMMPKAVNQSTPQSTLNSFLDSAKTNDVNKLIDSTILHFDTANRSLYVQSMSGANISMYDVKVVSMQDISMSSVPTDIKRDVTNFTTFFQNRFGVTIQESQFVKATIKQSENSTAETSYLLLSKVDGKWYFDIFVNYAADDWAADRSMSDQGMGFWGFGTSEDTLPVGSFSGTNSSGYWSFTLSSISSSSVRYADCQVQLTVGTYSSAAIAIPSSLKVTMPISGTSNSYDLTINDYGTSGYLSAGDAFRFGPVNNATGRNAYQPAGTIVTLSLIDAQTDEVFATGMLFIY